MGQDTFSLADLQISQELASDFEKGRAKASKSVKRRRKEPFTIIPNKLVPAIADALGNKGFPVVLGLFYLMRFGDQPVKLTSEALAEFGVTDMRQRTRVLRALQHAGLVSVVFNKNAAPLVTLLPVANTSKRPPQKPLHPQLRIFLAQAAQFQMDGRPKGVWLASELLPILFHKKPDFADDWPTSAEALHAIVRNYGLGRICRRRGRNYNCFDVPDEPKSETEEREPENEQPR
jgi:hypothetical protein